MTDRDPRDPNWTDEPTDPRDPREPADPNEPTGASRPAWSIAPPPAAAPPPAEAPAPAKGGNQPRSKQLGCLLEIVETVLLTFVIFFVIHNFVAQPFQVQLRSMESTFLEGDYVLVDRLSDLWSPYERGQVVIFEPPETWAEGNKPFIKRVIGIGGDTIEIRDGSVLVNGARLNEPYLFRGADGVIEPTEPTGGGSRWTVPQGELFVMGDHRQSSADSRVFGPIPEGTVIGRAVLRYWPFSKLGLIVTPTYAASPAP